MVKRMLWGAGAIVLVLAVIIVGRTVAFSDLDGDGDVADERVTAAVPPVDIDRAARHLGEAIRFRTISFSTAAPTAMSGAAARSTAKGRWSP